MNFKTHTLNTNFRFLRKICSRCGEFCSFPTTDGPKLAALLAQWLVFLTADTVPGIHTEKYLKTSFIFILIQTFVTDYATQDGLKLELLLHIIPRIEIAEFCYYFWA